MTITKTLDAARHVNILDITQATDKVMVVDSMNNVHFLNLVNAEQLQSARNVVAGEGVYDQFGNVRNNPSSNIEYDDSLTGIGAGSIQEALDKIIPDIYVRHVVTLKDTEALLAIAGATVEDKLSTLFGSQEVDGDTVLVGYTPNATGNDHYGGWRFNGTQWNQFMDYDASVQEAIAKYTDKLLLLSKAITATLTHLPLSEITSLDLATPDLYGKSYRLAKQAPQEGVQVYIDGLRVAQDFTPYELGYNLDYQTNTVTFSSPVAAGKIVQIEVLVPEELTFSLGIEIHNILNFDINYSVGTPGEIDGVKVEFPTFSMTIGNLINPLVPEELLVIKNGNPLIPLADFTVGNQSVIFSTPPQPGEIVWALWYKSSGCMPGGGVPIDPTGHMGIPAVVFPVSITPRKAEGIAAMKLLPNYENTSVFWGATHEFFILDQIIPTETHLVRYPGGAADESDTANMQFWIEEMTLMV